MIVDALLGLLLGVAETLVGALPAAGDLMLDGFGQAVSAFRAFDSGLPVSETIAMGLMCLSIIGGIFVVRLFITLYHMIPGKFT